MVILKELKPPVNRSSRHLTILASRDCSSAHFNFGRHHLKADIHIISLQDSETTLDHRGITGERVSLPIVKFDIRIVRVGFRLLSWVSTQGVSNNVLFASQLAA
ncbi:uncharacterized protein LOC129602284 [Paramacrobiotus metropolitanus]|uniref:uncharacterized protein LOC129602284 n=1 Tax=Paramacrobiotus metropolitanus TaxID=2943436 RepID=UPI002445CDE6|nr:uncharacterized protein LOC129602284 [Paramacrobiotus metropolitanus]